MHWVKFIYPSFWGFFVLVLYTERLFIISQNHAVLKHLYHGCSCTASDAKSLFVFKLKHSWSAKTHLSHPVLNRLGNTCPRPSSLSIPKVKISRRTVKAGRRWSTSITRAAFKLLFNSIFTYPQVISLKNSAGNFKQYHCLHLQFLWVLLQQTWYHS